MFSKKAKKPTKAEQEILEKTSKEVEQLQTAENNLAKLDAVLTKEVNEPIPDDPLTNLLIHRSSYKILVIGSGAKEHAIIEALYRSKFNMDIYNVGSYRNPGIMNLIKEYKMTNKTDEIVYYAHKQKFDLVIIGPEDYLENGIVDKLEEKSILCFGPTSALARIETDKAYARDLLCSYNLNEYNPIFKYFTKYDRDEISKFMTYLNNEFVIKSTRICNGMEVKVMGTDFISQNEALQYCYDLISSNEHGCCLIEEKLQGDKFNIVSFVDGVSLYSMPPIQNYRRQYDGNTGIHTSSMGSVSMSNHQLPFLSKDDILVANEIIKCVIAALQNETGKQYKGVISGNFIKTSRGIKVIEFNCRFGNSEVINLLSIMESDFMEVCLRTAYSALKYFDILCRNEATCVIYMVPREYPNTKYRKREVYVDEHSRGKILFGSVHLDEKTNDKMILLGSHAIAVIGKGNNLLEAKNEALGLLKFIHGPLEYRTDIGSKLIESAHLSISYESAGVNIDTNTQVVESIREIVESRQDNKVLSNYGDFCALVKGEKGCYGFSIDGIGTKPNFVLQHLEPEVAYYRLGYDVVNHGINDVITSGALPWGFLDGIAASRINPQHVKYLLKGIANACKEANCRILGGETAEMPNTYIPGAMDITGVMIGYSPERVIDSNKIKSGNIVIAWSSTGPHTNGYSLIQKILKDSNIKTELSDSEYIKLIEWLCNSHGSYYQEFTSYTATKVKIKGLAHITGGGLIENPARIMPEHLKMQLNLNKIKSNMSNNFKLLQKYGKLDDFTMLRTFNCGIGMLVVIDKEQLELIKQINKIRQWRHIWEVGVIKERDDDDQTIEFLN